MPYIWVKPAIAEEIEIRHDYICPTYITSKRYGVLTTIGLSDNYVTEIVVPMNEGDKQKKWIKRGVAMLTTLDD